MKSIRYGLIFRIALLVICVEIAAFGTLGWFYIERFSNEVDVHTHSRLQLVGRMIANEELAVSAISRISFMSEILGAPYLEGMVIGGNERVIVSTNPAYLGHLAASIPELNVLSLAHSAPSVVFIPDENTLTSVMHIRGAQGGAPVYYMVLKISTAELNAKKRSIMLWGEFGSLLFILLSTGGVVYIAQRLITRRVNSSLEALNKVAEGDVSVRIEVTSHDEMGRLQRGINTMTEKVGVLLSQHRRNVEEIRSTNQLLDSIVENIPNMLFLKRASDLRFVLFNKTGEQLLGIKREDLLGKNNEELFPKDEADFYTAHDRQALHSPFVLDIPEEEVTTGDGEKRILHTKKLALRDNVGDAEYILGISEDITERKKAEARISELAFFDQLTGLPNRTLLLDRLKQAMNTGHRNSAFGALLLIDLDNFKTLNDTLGHDMGDLLLKQVAQRLIESVREGDTVARLGGDEFVVVLTGLNSGKRETANAVESITDKMLDVLCQPYHLGTTTHHTTASIGVTLFKGDVASVDELIKQADLAMYKSKAAGRNAARFFDPSLEEALKLRAAMEEDLRRAIAENQFLLHFQPQMSADQLTGSEVLVRWQHPTRGLVQPDEFIPLAEETGMILSLGNWVLQTACTKLAQWADRTEFSHLTIAVNVSAHQFRHHDFVEQVLAVLKNTGANPHRLKLELTESLLVSNVDEVIEKMHVLKAKGIGFSLDDFGTGYSSLSYLKKLPLDQLKIDQSFVGDVLVNPNDASIAKTIIVLAQNLGLGVIAEGVETKSQCEFLASMGCHAYQGYWFSRPLPLEDFERYALGELACKS